MIAFLRPLLATCLFLLAPVGLRAAGSLAIAAAADLARCLDELNVAFLKVEPGAEIKVATGSSGNFATQIQAGAPFDIFLSADMDFPRQLIKSGFADASSLAPYAVGRLVLWTTRAGLDVTKGLELLRDPAIRKIAIANPDHAPYGRAAKAALEQAQVYDAIKDRLVLGENIAQTAQFVQTGNADAGIVALSLVLSPKVAAVGHHWEIPADTYPRLEQGMVITKRGMGNPLAARYAAFLRSQEARAVFDRFGFTLPADNP